MVQPDKDIRIVTEPIQWGTIWGKSWTTEPYFTEGGLSFNPIVERNDIRVDQFGYNKLQNMLILMRWTVKKRADKRWNKKRRHR